MASYGIGSSVMYDIRTRNSNLLFIASSENVKDLFEGHTLKEPKFMQLDWVLYTWFTAMCSEG
jgi:hypothetical protein